MTTEEKNIAIAEMLDAFKVEVWEEIKEQPYYKGTCFYLGSEDKRWRCGSNDADEVRKSLARTLKFDSDANWQYEAIDWIEKQGYEWQIEFQGGGMPARIIEFLDKKGEIVVEYAEFYKSYPEAVFEALYQFSQYLKQQNEKV